MTGFIPASRTDLESTIVIPRVTARPGLPAASADGFAKASAASSDGDDPDAGGGIDAAWPLAGLNPLVALACPLLDVLALLSTPAPATLIPPDARSLRTRLLHALGTFETGAQRAGLLAEHVLVARYALCTALDEAVARTPWGGASGWQQNSLLVTLHRESFGGARFFLLLDRALADPGRHIDLIELLALILSLGFEGSHAVRPDGAARLARLRQRLQRVLGAERGPADARLSPPMRPVSARPVPGLLRRVAAWLLAALMLASVWAGLSVQMARQAAAARASLAAIRFDPASWRRAAAAAGPPAAPRGRPSLRALLAAEVAAGWLDVIDAPGLSTVVFQGDALFDSGRAEVHPALLPVLARVAVAIDALPGGVTVAGYCDDRPLAPGLGFAGNEALSLERARRVAATLAAAIRDPARVHAVGLGAQRPRQSNRTPEGRARNRRVEILLAQEPAPSTVPSAGGTSPW